MHPAYASYFGVPGQWLLLGAIGVFGALFLGYAYRLFARLGCGGPAQRWDQPIERTRGWLLHVLAQGRLLRRPYPGSMHAMIFWGFLVVTLSTVEQFGQGLWPGFHIPFLSGSGVFAFMLDSFYLLVLVGIGMALYRRIAVKPWYLNLSGDALIILSLITVLMVSALVSEAAAVAGEYACGREVFAEGSRGTCTQIVGDWSYAGRMLAGVFGPGSSWFNWTLYQGAWWVHHLTVLGFLAYLPHSKHMHIVTAPFNVWFRTLEPKGRLPYLDVEAAIAEEQPLGVSSLEHLSWKDLLDTYTCTECGRCTSVCPASISGKPLSPKDVILDLRDALLERDGHRRGGQAAAGPSGSAARLVGDVITDEVLWDCTTCRACMDACPVFIEHVPKIVNMRRHLVMEESRFGKDVQTLFENLEATGNPWRFPRAQRAQWAEGLDVPTLAEAPDAEVLYWVGCSASYDQRSQKVARALVRLLQRAGVKLAILGSVETCTGDPARRTGNEYLYQQFVQENVPNLNAAQAGGIKTIVTSCPHCFNTLGQEYPEFGGSYSVVHHTQLLAELVAQKRFTPARDQEPGAGEQAEAEELSPDPRPPTPEKEVVAYHDPCYLGRYHDTYDEPRSILDAIPGVELREIDPCRERSMCCGAGGGRAFLEETRGRRINHIRLEQALASQPDRIATACPYCLMMFEDATATKGLTDTLPIQDVVEILEASLDGGEQARG